MQQHIARVIEAGGRGTAFDVTRAQAAADQSAAAVPAILATRKSALFALAALMGRTPADYPRELESCAAPARPTRPLPVGDGAALIRRRPDIRQSERALAPATATVGVETARLYPQVGLGGSAGIAGRRHIRVRVDLRRQHRRSSTGRRSASSVSAGPDCSRC